MLNARISRLIVISIFTLLGASPLLAADGNRLTYLDDPINPYYVHRNFPKLTTPMWIGEQGVDAVIILSIDDMREPPKYEKFIRPALDRLKKIDGKAHFSIMACKGDPNDPQLQKWLAEGLSIECHTFSHPCPMLQGGDFAKAKQTYDDCVDLMDSIPGNRAAAFRTPCCDSKNTFSPRMLAEIFNSKTAKGNFLEIDSSVFHRFTADDPALPRALVLDANGTDRYQRYVPFPSFANDIRDYPYPYVIGNTCWEFPCVTPTDWQSFHVQEKANPRLLADWEAQLDATVIKKGTFALCFHPYGWSSPQQIADLVDYADKKYGKHIRFLNFREALERLNKNVLGGQSLRAADGGDNGVRLLDCNNDGYLDVVIGNDKIRQTRLWDPKAGSWQVREFPVQLVKATATGQHEETGVKFGTVGSLPVALIRNESLQGAWMFYPPGDWTFFTPHRPPATQHHEGFWTAMPEIASVLDIDSSLFTRRAGIDQGVRLRDVDGSAACNVIVSNPRQNTIYRWDLTGRHWSKLPFALPQGISIVDEKGRDNGLRFVDIDDDGYADIVFSNDKTSALYLFGAKHDGWNRIVMNAPRKPGDQTQLPPIVRADGTNNGAWFLHRTMWVQNEDTATLPDVVDRRTFNSLLAKVDPIAKSPKDSRHAIQTKPGFTCELMVSEPLVESPIAIAWGPDGRLWVVEMGDYPLGLDGKGKPGGRVRILESTRNDGHYDKSTLFLDGLNFPTGVMPWGKGVLITAAPEIFYAEDSKRDGHCDIRKTLFTGFVEGNQQHRVNGLQWGLDNWVHGANGHSGGNIRSFKGGEEIKLGSRDFRIRPDEGLFDPETGVTQYGHCMDDWGNWYGCDNSNPSFQFVIEDRYLRRNKFYPAPSVRVPVSNQPGAAAVYAISPTVPRFNDPFGADHFTSANSFTIYRDTLFGPSFYGNCYVSEPVHDLVHREVMHREGLLMKSARAEDETTSEFWASTDNWTRPTMLRTGPDGALWIVDMYRYVIEHPQWIPKDWQARIDLRAGQDKGRIYRVYPVGVTPRPVPRFDHLDTAGLVAALDSESGWQRDLVQQMLVQKQDNSAAPLLRKTLLLSKNPLAALHALCALDGLNALDANTLITALISREPGIRRQAVRLCEGRFEQSPLLAETLSDLTNDPDDKVRLQLACTMGEWNDPRAGAIVGRLLLKDSANVYIAAGAFSSINDKNLDAVVRAVMSGGKENPAPQEVIAILLKIGNGLGNAKATTTLLATVTRGDNGKFTSAQFASLAGLLDAMEASGDSLQKLAASDDPELKAAVHQLDAVFDAARAVAHDAQAKSPDRAAALGVLARGGEHQAQDLKLLAEMLVPQAADELQRAAAATLGRLRSREASNLLLAGWRSYGPALRAQTLDLLVTRDEPAGILLDAIAKKKVPAADIDAPHRQRLLQSKNKALRARAAELFAAVVNVDRQKVIDNYKATMTLKGSAAHGSELFAKTCAVCHLLNGQGKAVGPDLASVGDKSTEGLMIAILDPNRAVEPQYINYLAETKDGDTISGVMAAETGNSVTLRIPDAIEKTILRANLKQLRSTGMSLMPEGLETGMSPQDLADVIAFVQSSVPAPKLRTLDGNHPQLVMPTVDGALNLSPTTCEVYGSKIVLEKKYGNLGFWQGDDDHAVWTLQPARAGKYAVWLDYACDAGSAGNTLLLHAGGERLTWRIESTGNWDTYHRIRIGEITLSAARQRFTARSLDKLHGTLLDLRAIEMYPIAEK
jgi:putative membrane-bound dehydrogenase-like protein